ncbi:unnamed protein product [Mytilus edulis]|uniref:Reverse transcriptase domain-containing protein n=1 Tax=Mytilus edulis TaxID=6550 RepID=A0A8S3RTW4_MYTED|nr:unnamed protein product [Mytilus edulis]
MKLTCKNYEGTNEKLDKLETENRSMNSKINKQNERLINIQNQLTLSRSTISRLKDENSHLEKTVTNMSEKLCQSSKIHENKQNVIIMELTNKRNLFSISYLSEVLRNNDIDICALSEHWLRSYQLHILDSIDSNFVSISKGVDESNIESLRVNDRSGVAFLVSKVIYPYTSVIDCNNSRFLGIEVNIPNCETFFAFCAYLLASSHSIDFFREHVEYMFELYTTYQEIGTVVLLGDFNTKINGPRYMFSSDQRSDFFRSLMIEHNLVSVNMEAICTGPVCTFQSHHGGPATGIDHIIINVDNIENIRKASVLDNHTFCISDHHPVLNRPKSGMGPTKAFDTVPHDGLRLKLHEYGAHGKLWLLLDNMYTNLYGAVSSNGKLSKWFELKRGIRQGSSLSAKLYLIFINDLINELESSKEGAFFHDLNASSPVQADDIAIIATNCVSTQRMVTICENYSNMGFHVFTTSKL